MKRTLIMPLAALLASALMMTGLAGAAGATSPCRAPESASFAQIVRDAPVIVHGRALSQDKDSTQVEIVETLKGDAAADRRGRVRISGWRYDSPPLFAYEKGAEFIFLLSPSPSGRGFVLSDASWKDCVPALAVKIADGRFAVNQGLMTKESFTQEFLSDAETAHPESAPE